MLTLVTMALGTVDNGTTPCSTALDCSLNGLCVNRTCQCDTPWSGPRCGHLDFVNGAPSAGRDLWPANDTKHSTWNGPMIGPIDGVYHMYLPIYANPSNTPLYNPTNMFHGTADHRLGPWKWEEMKDVDVNFNPGFLEFGHEDRKHYTLWVSGHPGKIYHSFSPNGPFTEFNGSETGCDINPSPIFVDGHLYCTGQKGTTIMTAPHLGGPWTQYANISEHVGEDPFLYLDKRQNWHALFHAANGGQINHCGAARVSMHMFSQDAGKSWSVLSNPTVEPYKPLVVWDNGVQTFSSMERPHAYFDPTTGDMTYLSVAAPLNIGDEGCANGTIGRAGCKAKRPPCPCCNCKYLSHAGTVLIALRGSN